MPQLTSVPLSVPQSQRVPAVRIETLRGHTFDVKAFDLGSDPNVVAALIQFYLDHPQYREYLTDPEKAIRIFSEAQTTQ